MRVTWFSRCIISISGGWGKQGARGGELMDGRIKLPSLKPASDGWQLLVLSELCFSHLENGSTNQKAQWLLSILSPVCRWGHGSEKSRPTGRKCQRWICPSELQKRWYIMKCCREDWIYNPQMGRVLSLKRLLRLQPQHTIPVRSLPIPNFPRPQSPHLWKP